MHPNTSEIELAEQLIAEYVLSGRHHEPDETIQKLKFICDVEHVQQPWVWKALAEAAFETQDVTLFLEFSHRFIFSSKTQRADFRTGKADILIRRLRFLIEKGAPYAAEVSELVALTPTQRELDEVSFLGIEITDAASPTFDDNQVILYPSPANIDRTGTLALNGEHFAARTDPAVPPSVRIIEDADYLSWQGDSALFKGGIVYRRLSRAQGIQEHYRKLIDSGNRVHHSGTAVVLNDVFTLSNYCHWMLDWLPRLLIAQHSLGLVDFVLTRHANAAFELESLIEIAGLSAASVLKDDENIIRSFDRLVVVDNDRIADTHPIWRGNPQIIAMVRDKILTEGNTPIAKQDRKRRLYLSRRDVGNRGIINEAECERVMRAYGIETVDVSGLSVHEQALMFANTEFVVSVHGAGLTNAIFMPRGSTVLEILHYRFGSAAYSTLSRGCGHRYAYISCDDVDGSSAPVERPVEQKEIRFQYANVWLDASVLDRSLHQLLSV